MADNNNKSGNKSGNQGFASMDKDKQRKIASEGGKASHSSGNNQSGGQSGSSS